MAVAVVWVLVETFSHCNFYIHIVISHHSLHLLNGLMTFEYSSCQSKSIQKESD